MFREERTALSEYLECKSVVLDDEKNKMLPEGSLDQDASQAD